MDAVDLVNHPPHYLGRDIYMECGCTVCGKQKIECIDITRHFDFNLGNAIKYIWRSDFKGNKKQDLEKAIWYLQDAIQNL